MSHVRQTNRLIVITFGGKINEITCIKNSVRVVSGHPDGRHIPVPRHMGVPPGFIELIKFEMGGTKSLVSPN